MKPVLLPAPCWWLLLILPRLRADHPHLPPCSGQPSSRAQLSVPQAAAVMNGELERRGRLGKHHLLKKKKKNSKNMLWGFEKHQVAHAAMPPCNHPTTSHHCLPRAPALMFHPESHCVFSGEELLVRCQHYLGPERDRGALGDVETAQRRVYFRQQSPISCSSILITRNPLPRKLLSR